MSQSDIGNDYDAFGVAREARRKKSMHDCQSQTHCHCDCSVWGSEPDINFEKKGSESSVGGKQSEYCWYQQLGSLIGFNKLDTSHTINPVEDEQIRHHRNILEPVLCIQKDGYMMPESCKAKTPNTSSCAPQPQKQANSNLNSNCTPQSSTKDKCNSKSNCNANTNKNPPCQQCQPCSGSSNNNGNANNFPDFEECPQENEATCFNPLEEFDEEDLNRAGSCCLQILTLNTRGTTASCKESFTDFLKRKNKEREEEERLCREKEEAEAERLRKIEEEQCSKLQKEECEQRRRQQEEAERLRIQHEEEIERLRKKHEEEFEQRIAEEERLRQQREEEECLRRQMEEECRRLQAEEEYRLKQEECRQIQEAAAERRRLQEEEERQRRLQEEACRRRQEAEERRRQHEEELKQRQEERERRRQQEEEERQRRKEEAECRRRQQEEEAQRRREEEEERRRQREEAELRRREEDERRRQQEEERRLQEEECRRQQEEQRLREEEERRLLEEQRRLEEEERWRQEEEEWRRREEEEDRKCQEDEECRRREEEEECRRRQEEEDRRCQEDDECRRRLEEEERLRREEEEECRRRLEEESAIRRQKLEECRCRQEEECRNRLEEDERRKRQAEEDRIRREQEEECRRREAEDANACASNSSSGYQQDNCCNDYSPVDNTNDCGDNTYICNECGGVCSPSRSPSQQRLGSKSSSFCCSSAAAALPPQDDCCTHCNWEWDCNNNEAPQSNNDLRQIASGACARAQPASMKTLSCLSKVPSSTSSCTCQSTNCKRPSNCNIKKQKRQDPLLEELNECCSQLAEIKEKLACCQSQSKGCNSKQSNENCGGGRSRSRKLKSCESESNSDCDCQCPQCSSNEKLDSARCDESENDFQKKRRRRLGSNASIFKASCAGCSDGKSSSCPSPCPNQTPSTDKDQGRQLPRKLNCPILNQPKRPLPFEISPEKQRQINRGSCPAARRQPINPNQDKCGSETELNSSPSPTFLRPPSPSTCCTPQNTTKQLFNQMEQMYSSKLGSMGGCDSAQSQPKLCRKPPSPCELDDEFDNEDEDEDDDDFDDKYPVSVKCGDPCGNQFPSQNQNQAKCQSQSQRKAQSSCSRDVDIRERIRIASGNGNCGGESQNQNPGCDKNAINKLKTCWAAWDRIARNCPCPASELGKPGCENGKRTKPCPCDPCKVFTEAEDGDGNTADAATCEDDDEEEDNCDCCDPNICPECGAELDENGCPIEEEEYEIEVDACGNKRRIYGCYSKRFEKDDDGRTIYEGGMCIPRVENFLWQTSDDPKTCKCIKDGFRRLGLPTEFLGFGCKDKEDPKDCREITGGLGICETQNFMWQRPLSEGCSSEEEKKCGGSKKK